MPARVLLVDDDAAILQLLKTVLELDGFAVTTAACAADAVQVLAREDFDLVLTDMRMETHTAGFEVVRAATARTPRPAIVILTAYPIPAVDWHRSGADALFVKGAQLGSLTQMLHGLLRRGPDSESGRSGVRARRP